MRPILFAAAALTLLPAAASAGDTAKRTLIGFSEDGSVFSFMESGVQDGSGFPYATVYFVDIASDSWAAPPVEVELREEAAIEGEGQAVRQAIRRATPLLEEQGVSIPARLLWSQPITETTDGDPEKHGAYPGAMAASFTDNREGPFTLHLEEIEMASARCAEFDVEVKGFSLAVEALNTTQVIYRDDSLPDSRGCPLGYSISDVLEGPADADGGRPIVVMVNVFRLGFEGWDRRFLAVPIPAPDEAR